MYLIYVDESGTPEIKDSENFVLGALIINEDKWFEIDEKVRSLKEKHFSSKSNEFEIHMCDIVHRKAHFSKFQIPKRIEIIGEISDLIKSSDIRVVYIVIRKPKLLKSINIRYWAYNFLFERLCYQLRDLNRDNDKIEYGLLLFDSISKKRNNEIWNIVSKLLKEGGWYKEKNEHLIDGPIFSESTIRSPLQLADCIAYVVNHHHKINKNKNEEIRKILEKSFEIIEQKIPCEKRYARKVFP